MTVDQVIQLKNVTKTYGSNRGITGVNLDVPAGSVYGFLGPNGAGKTTTISMLINLTRPTKGKINIFGKDNTKNGIENRARIGFLANDMAFNKGLTGWQQLEFFGYLHGVFDKPYVRELAQRFKAELDKKIKTLSRGNRQKIGLIAALMHKPELLILDEPTSGLDPLVQAEFNKLIIENQKLGKTTFISSHMLSEVQDLCDQVAFIREGKIVLHDTVKAMIDSLPRVVRLSSDGSFHPAQLIEDLKGVSQLIRHDHSVAFNFNGDINELLTRLTKRSLRNVLIQNAELEDVFMSFYKLDTKDKNV